MIFVFLACYIILILAAIVIMPFRISSAESKQERDELMEAKR